MQPSAKIKAAAVNIQAFSLSAPIILRDTYPDRLALSRQIVGCRDRLPVQFSD
jgi:hypothetical protein